METPPPPSEPVKRRRDLKEFAIRELRRFVLLFLYLWAMFLLFDIHQYMILAEHHIRYQNWGFGLLNALVLAKVMVVADEVHFNTQRESRPLIYPIVLRSCTFAILFIVFDILEKVVVGAFSSRGISQSLPTYGSGGLLGTAMVGIIIAFSLLPFFAFEEIDRALGQGRLSRLLLRPREAGAESH